MLSPFQKDSSATGPGGGGSGPAQPAVRNKRVVESRQEQQRVMVERTLVIEKG